MERIDPKNGFQQTESNVPEVGGKETDIHSLLGWSETPDGNVLVYNQVLCWGVEGLNLKDPN